MPQEIRDFLLGRPGASSSSPPPGVTPTSPTGINPQENRSSDVRSFLLSKPGGGSVLSEKSEEQKRQEEEERRKREEAERQTAEQKERRKQQLAKMMDEAKRERRSFASFVPESMMETFFPSTVRLLRSTGGLNEKQVRREHLKGNEEIVFEPKTITGKKTDYVVVKDTSEQEKSGKWSDFSTKQKAFTVGGTILEIGSVGIARGIAAIPKVKQAYTALRGANTARQALRPAATVAGAEAVQGAVTGAAEAGGAGESVVEGAAIGGISTFLLFGAGSMAYQQVARSRVQAARQAIDIGDEVADNIARAQKGEEPLIIGDMNRPNPQRSGYSNNINLSKFPEPIRDTVKGMAEELDSHIKTQRRGIISDDRVTEAAKNRTVMVEELTPGSILPAEEAQAAINRASDLVLEAVKETSASSLERAKRGIVGYMGLRAEYGRGLRVFKNQIEQGDAIAQMALKMAEDAADPVEQETLIRFADMARKGVRKTDGFINKFVEVATAVKLTNLRTTPARAFGGNVFATLLRMPEEAITTAFGAARSTVVRMFGGTPTQTKAARELMAEGAGLFHGFGEGSIQAARILTNWTDESLVTASRAIEDVSAGQGGAIKGTVGKVVRSPFRLLAAIDAPFRAANERASMMELATRQALREGLEGEQLLHRVYDIVSQPTNEFKNMAANQGRQFVFQNDLEGIMKTLNNARAKHPWLKVPIAFFKTPVNLATFTAKRTTPLGLIMPSTIRELRAGGIARDRALARVALGSTISAGTTIMAYMGHITGAPPDDKGKRDALYRTGWQPYSVKIGGRYYSYSGFEPMATYLATGAAIADNFFDKGEVDEKSLEERALSMVADITENWANLPFVSGLTDILGAIADPERNLSSAVEDQVTGLIPSGLAELARQQDTVKRQADGIAESVMLRIPFLRQQLLPQQTVFGEDIPEADETVSPVRVTDEIADKTEDELLRLEVFPGMPSKRLTAESDMTDEEYYEYVQITGQATKTILDTMVSSGGWDSVPDDKKIELINSVVSKVRREVKDQFIVDIARSVIEERSQ